MITNLDELRNEIFGSILDEDNNTSENELNIWLDQLPKDQLNDLIGYVDVFFGVYSSEVNHPNVSSYECEMIWSNYLQRLESIFRSFGFELGSVYE